MEGRRERWAKGNWLMRRNAPPLSVAAPAAGTKQRYDVRLYFVEPRSIKPSERVFSVSLEGKPVLTDFDAVKEAGKPLKPVLREFKDVEVEGPLDIRLAPSAGTSC